MRTKALLTSILLGSLALAGVASASPVIRDHRSQPIVTRPAVQIRYDHRVNPEPTTYGYQVSANGQWVQGYTYGNDPYVEGIARGEWSTLQSCVEFQGSGNVRLDLNDRRLRSLELQATSGDVQIRRVGIQYKDGSHGFLTINRALDVTHAPNLRLDLGAQGRQGVAAIVLYGQGNASFRVLGA
jgi:hypothetical protein